MSRSTTTDQFPGHTAGSRLIAFLVTLLRALLGTAVAVLLLLIILALFYTLFIDLNSGESLRARPYGDTLLVLLWSISALAGGCAAAWRARRRYLPALLTGLMLILLFDLARQVILPAQELWGPVPAMVYWIILLLIPTAMAGAYLAPSR